MKALHLSALGTALFLAALGTAHAAAVIINPAGTVALGVKDTGALNTRDPSGTLRTTNASGYFGVAYNFGTATEPDWRDATAPGCLCEGWGVSVNGTTSGYDGTENGAGGLSVLSFTSTATTATSVTALAALPGLKVTQSYAPSANAPGALFVNTVTITNDTDNPVNNVNYVRVMDWDVPPTEFSEFVTIKGTGTTTLLERSHNDGFETPNPLASDSPIDAVTLDVDFSDYFSELFKGDHGAYFRFNFGRLNPGESYTFSIYYGAAPNESAAIAAIAAEGIELYSLGQSNLDGSANNNGVTFIFGFKGVGGTPLECGGPNQPACPDNGVPGNGVPEPGVLGLLGLGLLVLTATRRRKA
jgi:type IV pilus assembly protein PilY1